ncbi:hypothetical protein K435DRAFT_162330 [Dendrothele bispora CBS 962.96]|uniref:Uncharacterized protein n=1 Tax=Dendrothele bispora (strain CBS 962.96) TaxID=1314807 RepID=A0A4S8MR48_DENBC|nr:hypothetical protein K435DRAFT_162330 [Dendrothele bispora CBS 962.96]
MLRLTIFFLRYYRFRSSSVLSNSVSITLTLSTQTKYLEFNSDDTKQNFDDALALTVKIKMVTGDQLAVAKVTNRRLGLGDRIVPRKGLKDGLTPGGKHASLGRNDHGC